jgi:hypothetical protein
LISLMEIKYQLTREATSSLLQMVDVLYEGLQISYYHFDKMRNLNVGITVQKYHYCKNECYIFLNQQPGTQVQQCPRCDHDRFDSNSKPFKVYQYLPLIPQLCRLYDTRYKRYPADQLLLPVGKACNERGTLYGSPGWREHILDDIDFCSERRNIALGFSSDGANPFRSGVDTFWPLVLRNLNLPPYIGIHAVYSSHV